jgi:hypothetical protein
VFVDRHTAVNDAERPRSHATGRLLRTQGFTSTPMSLPQYTSTQRHSHSPSHRSCHLLLKPTRGVTIALVSSRERKRRQPGLTTDDPAFVGWHQLVRGIQGS